MQDEHVHVTIHSYTCSYMVRLSFTLTLYIAAAGNIHASYITYAYTQWHMYKHNNIVHVHVHVYTYIHDCEMCCVIFYMRV